MRYLLARRQLRYIFMLGFLLTGLIGVRGAQAKIHIDPTEFSAWADKTYQNLAADHRFAGAVLTVVQDGKIIYSRGFGYEDVEKKIPVGSAVTKFRLNSVSKTFTATAIAQLLSDGKIKSLDDPVNKYLKSIKIPDNNGIPITFWDILNHRAGFEDKLFNLATDVRMPAWIKPSVFKRQIPAYIDPAGQVTVYSNFGANTLGFIIQEISGLSFSDYVEANILKPLGMAHCMAQPLLLKDIPHQAKGYSLSADGKWIPYPTNWSISSTYTAAGGITCSGDDMARYMIAQLNAGGGANSLNISPAVFALMHNAHNRQHPAVNGFGMLFFVSDWNGEKLVEHGGVGVASRSSMTLLPDSNIGIFFARTGTYTPHLGEKKSGSDDGKVLQQPLTLSELRAIYLKHLLGKYRPPASLFSNERVDPEKYEGTYLRHRRNRSTAETALDMLIPEATSIKVKKINKDTLDIYPYGHYKEIAPDVFWRETEGPGNSHGFFDVVAFYSLEKGDKVDSLAFLYDDDSATKHPWWWNPGILKNLLFICWGIGATGFLAWFWPTRSDDKLSNGARILPTALTVLLGLVPVVWFEGFLGTYGSVKSAWLLGHPARMEYSLVLTNLYTLGAVVMIGLTILAWKEKWWESNGVRGLLRRGHYTIISLFALLAIFCLAQNNLIGWKIPQGAEPIHVSYNVSK